VGAFAASAGGVGVDRGASDEVGGSVVGVEQGERGDDDLNLRADRAQGPGPSPGRSDRASALPVSSRSLSTSART
jgi:hypothetical protein